MSAPPDVLSGTETAEAHVLRSPKAVRSGRRAGIGLRLIRGLAVVAAIVWTIPTIGVLVSSFRPEQLVDATGWWTAFTDWQWTLENYRTVLGASSSTQGDLAIALLNSLLVTVPSVLLPMVLGTIAAYAFAWMRFPGRRVLFAVAVGLIVLPLQMALIPLLSAFSEGASLGSMRVFPALNLNGTLASAWIAHTGFGLSFAIFLIHDSVSRLPEELIQAARVDGATHADILVRIVVPLIRPVLAAYIIFQFLWVWNDYLIAVTFLGSGREVAPLTVRLAALVGSRGEDQHLLTAGAFVSAVVPLAVFFSMQRSFVRGLLGGALKS